MAALSGIGSARVPWSTRSDRDPDRLPYRWEDMSHEVNPMHMRLFKQFTSNEDHLLLRAG
jgi:hypothetical protein